MKIVSLTIALAIAVFCGACSSLPPPGRAYDSKLFAVEPVIVQRGDRLYLRYRMKLDGHPLRMYVIVKKEESKGVAYFASPVSFPEYGALHEIPLFPHEVEDFARNGRFFWRDPDGREKALPLITEN